MITITVLLLFSCNEDPTMLRGRDLIPKRKLVQILTEIHMLDAVATNPDNHHLFPGGDSVRIYNNIFKKYEVTSAEFDSTIAMYSRRPDQFVKIYNDVILKLDYINDTVNKNNPGYSKEGVPSLIEK